jgi:REP element-mobilizing transposase RayT
MPRRDIVFQPGHFYHIYHRGNDRCDIFFEEENYSYFLFLMHRHLPSNEIRIHAYCLMMNHFHILVELVADCNLSRSMKNLLIAYTKAINKRYRRVGHLFQGQFRCKEVDSEQYALTLSRYIHANPVSAGFVTKSEEWKYSSYRIFLGLDSDPRVTTNLMNNYFKNIAEYREFVESMPVQEYKVLRHEHFKDP